jgi:pentose-5-phosphate-3-epimerase
MNGHFVPNITFGPQMCAALRPHIQTVMDVYRMVAPVDPYIEAFAKAGADVLVAGSAVFKDGSVRNPKAYGANIAAIRTAAIAALKS